MTHAPSLDHTPSRPVTLRWRIARWLIAAALVATPWLAMQYTAEVRWSPGDFAVFGGMLAAVLVGYELAAAAGQGAWFRMGAAAALATGFATLWVNLAVGIAGAHPASAAFLLPPVLAVAGALWAGGRAARLWRSAAATAVVQLLLAIGVAGWVPARQAQVLALGAMFTAGWLVAAGLFHRAARRR